MDTGDGAALAYKSCLTLTKKMNAYCICNNFRLRCIGIIFGGMAFVSVFPFIFDV